jgi:2-amino-4-hydroxy-6-hydroxymethyldihydropteridine diphosphokinase
MILIGLGANLPRGPASPRETLEAVLRALPRVGIELVQVSPWYETEPQPPSEQPWYVNGVAEVATTLGPAALLTQLHALEAEFGRDRDAANAARTLDLDLLAHGEAVLRGPVVVPHPRLADRAFVLMPLCDIAPEWRHPVSGLSAAELRAALKPGQGVRRLPGTRRRPA